MHTCKQFSRGQICPQTCGLKSAPLWPFISVDALGFVNEGKDECTACIGRPFVGSQGPASRLPKRKTPAASFIELDFRPIVAAVLD